MPSIDGLASGLNTTDIVKQLMAAERMSGKRLYTGKADATSAQDAFTKLNGLFNSLKTAAGDLTDAVSYGASIWGASAAKSSNDAVAKATADAKAATGDFSFTVQSLATADVQLATTTHTSSEKLNPTGDLIMNLGVGGENFDINVKKDATLADVAAAINKDSKGKITAAAVQTSPGNFQLQIRATATGDGNTLAINNDQGLIGATSQLSIAADAKIWLNNDPAVEITSHSNTFSNLMTGVNVTVLKADTANPVTVSVNRDIDAMANKVEAMVKAANDAVSNIRDNAKWDPVKKDGGPFVADSTTRDLVSRLSGAFVGTAAGNSAMAGISVDKSGTFTFDKTKFKEAYANDASAVESAVSNTAKSIHDVAKFATHAVDGSLTIRIKGEQTMVQDYSKQITNFEDKMSLREKTLLTKFQGLESMLNKLKGQGNWLAGQLASLPTNQKN